MSIRAFKRFAKNDRGAVAATYALALIPLVAFAGLAYDYTRLVGMDTELQNAADQAALAGATQLDRTSGSMERAIAAIQGGLVNNFTAFANDGATSGQSVDITNSTQIIFFPSKADAEAGTNGFTNTSNYANARFVQVTVDTRAARFAFTPIVGAMGGSLNGTAVAGMGSALCRIPPLMICNPDEGNQGGAGEPGATFDIANRKGDGMKVVEGPTGSGPSYWEPGDYGFLDLGAGADAVSKGLGWLAPEGLCTSVDGNETIAPDTEPGLKTGAIDAINTRFDIYQNNSSCKTPGQCPASLNARKDLVRDAEDTPSSSVNACAVHNQGWHQTGGTRYEPSSTDPSVYTATPYSMGHPRDTCHAVSAGGSCSEGKFGDGVWDRNAYFRTHYVRYALDAADAAYGTRWNAADWVANIKTGVDPVTTAEFPVSRYRVYLWEIANAGKIVDGVRILDPDPPGASGTTELRQPTPICSQQNGFSGTMTDPDRRVMTVAVVNCTAEKVRGKTQDVAIATWIDVFLVQPSVARTRSSGGALTSQSDIYFEVIRATNIKNTGTNTGLLVRRDVPYLVK